MTVSGTHIIEDTLRRGFSWTCFQTLLNAGEKGFDFPAILAQNSIYYVSQGLTRYAMTKVETFKDFKPETQRILVYSATFFATAFLVPRVFSMMGRAVEWQNEVRRAAASTAFWFFLNSSDEFTKVK